MELPEPDQHPRRCTARRTNGQPCRRWACRGSDVCVNHGGAAPQTRAAAARRLSDDRARAAVVAFGLPVDIDPHEALLQEVHASAGAVAWLRDQVARLDPLEVVWGTVVDRDGEKGYTERRAAPNVLVVLLGEWSDRLTRAAKAAINAGVAERVVRIEERKGEMIGKLIAAVLDDPELGLSVGQQVLARQVAARHLRALPDPLA